MHSYIICNLTAMSKVLETPYSDGLYKFMSLDIQNANLPRCHMSGLLEVSGTSDSGEKQWTSNAIKYALSISPETHSLFNDE